MEFLAHAKAHGKPVLVDPSRLAPLSLYHGVDMLTPNLVEAEALTGFRPQSSKTAGWDDKRLEAMARTIMDSTACAQVVITCGAAGMVLLEQDGSFQRVPTFAREVFDVTGAGDTVVALMSLMRAVGYPSLDAMRVANAAAGIVVGRMGTATVTPAELKAELERLGDLTLVSRG